MTFSEDLRIRFIDNKPQVYDRHRPDEYIAPVWDYHISNLFQSWSFLELDLTTEHFDTFYEALTYLMDR